MLNNEKNQILYIFLPLLLKLLAFVAVYTVINLYIFKALDIDDDILNIYIPLVIVPIYALTVTKRPFLVFDYEDKDDSAASFSKYIICVALVALTCLTQYIVTEKSAKILHLTSVNELSENDLVTYYTFEDFKIDKKSAIVTPRFEVVGKYGQHFQMSLYVAIPMYSSEVKANTDTPYWYGIVYWETIDNDLNIDEKDRLYQEFYTASFEKYNKENFHNVSYFERLKNYSEKSFFIDYHPYFNEFDKKEITILSPNKDDFDGKLTDFGAWWIITLTLTILIIFWTTFIPDMNTSRWRDFYHGKKLHNENSDNLIDLLLPRKGFFITPILINLNLLIFIIIAISSFSLMSIEGNVLVSWGANFYPNVKDGEWWRLIASIFLHSGAIHLILNLYVLYIIGLILEPEIKSTKFIILFLLLGAIASLSSLYWKQDVVSVGASGAIFGMVGIYLSLLATNSISEESKSFLTRITIITAVTLLMGVMYSSFDNAAHIGGLISGLTLGFILSPFIKKDSQEILG